MISLIFPGFVFIFQNVTCLAANERSSAERSVREPCTSRIGSTSPRREPASAACQFEAPTNEAGEILRRARVNRAAIHELREAGVAAARERLAVRVESL